MPVRKFKDLPNAFRNFREDLNPNGIRRVLFLKSEWENFVKNNGVSIPYLVYRAIYMVYFMIAIVFSATCVKKIANYYYLYLTHWALVTQAIYGTLFFINVFYHFLVERFRKEDVAAMDVLLPSKLNILEKCIWVLQSPISVLPLVVSIVYWIILYPEIMLENIKTPPIEEFPNCAYPSNCLVHAGNSVFAVIEVMVCALPVHVTHFVYLVIYATIYATFTGIYEAAGGQYPFAPYEYIYPILNWRCHPGLTIANSIGVAFGAAILHMVLWAVYIARLILVATICKYDVYAYHEYTYRTRGNTPVVNRSTINVAANLDTITANQADNGDRDTNLKSGNEPRKSVLSERITSTPV